MSEINEENDSPEFFNFDGMSSPLKDEKKDKQEKKRFKLKRFIIIISIIMIIAILAISIYFIIQAITKEEEIECNPGYYFPNDEETKSKSNCKKCSVDNCDKCSGTKEVNTCKSCISNYFAINENNKITKCNPCDIGEDDKCLSCDEGINKCSKCNTGYKLENGKCILNYSFKATYSVDSNKRVSLINYSCKNNIKEVIIDGNIQTEINYAYELEYGNHVAFILLDINSLPDHMFTNCGDMKEIFFFISI